MGRWRNYDDLEESLCLDELIATVNALRDQEQRNQKFHAALNGVDIDDVEDKVESKNDIVDLKGFQAQQEGFGIGAGLGYMEVGV